MKITSITVPLLFLCAYVNADTVYWANYSTNHLRFSNQSVEERKDFCVNAGAEFALVCKGSHIYWADEDSNTIKRANLDGSNVISLLTFSDIQSVSVGDVKVSNSFICWTQTAGVDHAIYYAGLDGSNIRKSAAWGVRPSTKIGVDNDRIFIPAYKSIWRHETGTGTSVQVIGGLPDSPWYIGYYNEYLYWAYSSGGKLYRAKPGDGAFQLVIDAAHPIEDFVFTPHRIYMSYSSRISSCNFDGSDFVTTHINDGFVGGIAASEEVLFPSVSIGAIGGKCKITYSGILKRSVDLKNWVALSPQPESPWEVQIDVPVSFFRAESTYP